MQLVLSKPLNSSIEVLSEANKTVISWKNPRGSSRFAPAIFMLAWLGGWAVGEFFVIKTLLFGGLGGVSFFLLFWLIGWTVGGFFAMKSVYQLLRPTKPEALSLDAFTLNYQSGTEPPAENGWSNKRQNIEALESPNRKSKYQIPKSQAGAVKLERVGERQRLTIDHGAERIEIGRFLSEPEREWLYEVIKQWKGNL